MSGRASLREARCECGHASDWHSHGGVGDCEHDADCGCASFRPAALFPVADLAALEALGDWLDVADLGDGDTAPWAETLRRVVALAHAANKALTEERDYASALEVEVCRGVLQRIKTPPAAASDGCRTCHRPWVECVC